ncbi:MAG: DUF5606 domain-containing protein [Rikenellaceae bacterium]|nr:DUF5606 domain-containing protein [Rikenellaceae bacterium]MDY3893020.1 DUF5606 domain-containing protein [Candidatus Cryptobacteroides sp.]
MKTDLSKILSITGQSGLYRYIAHSRGGVIAENLTTGKRTCFSLSSRITTLADISIYTREGELRLSEVFKKIETALEGAQAPSSKADAEQVKAVFEKAVPDYDGERFYLSHMKKVVDWYNLLLKYASLDFVTEEDAESAE